MESNTANTEEITENTPLEDENQKTQTTNKRSLSDLLGLEDDSEKFEQERGDKPRRPPKAPKENGGEEPNEPVRDYEVDPGTISEQDRVTVIGLIGTFDYMSSVLFSMRVYGNWQDTAPFMTYTNLDGKEHKHFVDSAVLVYKRWNMKWGPEMVVGASLCMSMFMKWQLSKQLLESNSGQPAPSDTSKKETPVRQLPKKDSVKAGML